LYSGNKFQACLSLSGDECVVVIRGAFREKRDALFVYRMGNWNISIIS
jgi:hypothetical protein